MDKKKDFLGLDDETDVFEKKALDKKFKKNIYDSKKGKILLDLQKTFKGDDRFHLDKSFKNDIEFEKLPNAIKQANLELQYDIEEKEKVNKKIKETDIKHEKNGQFSILKQMFPRERIKNEDKSEQTEKKSLIVQRFDPKQLNSKKFIINEKNEKASTKNKKKNVISLVSGIDKKKKNFIKAEAILKAKIHKKTDIKDVPTKKIKKIDYKAWKELIQDNNNDQNTKLFSK